MVFVVIAVTKRKITMTVDERVFAAFKQYCRANGMKVSSRVEIMMRDFLAGTESRPREPRAPIKEENDARERNPDWKRGDAR